MQVTIDIKAVKPNQPIYTATIVLTKKGRKWHKDAPYDPHNICYTIARAYVKREPWCQGNVDGWLWEAELRKYPGQLDDGTLPKNTQEEQERKELLEKVKNEKIVTVTVQAEVTVKIPHWCNENNYKTDETFLDRAKTALTGRNKSIRIS